MRGHRAALRTSGRIPTATPLAVIPCCADTGVFAPDDVARQRRVEVRLERDGLAHRAPQQLDGASRLLAEVEVLAPLDLAAAVRQQLAHRHRGALAVGRADAVRTGVAATGTRVPGWSRAA